MTPAQIQTFATALQAEIDQSIVDALADGDNNAIADWYNAPADPAFYVFEATISKDDIVGAMDWDNEYVTFKDELLGLSFLFEAGAIDPQPENTRKALAKILTGATASRDAILTIATKITSRIEAMFAITANGPAGGDGLAANAAAVSANIGTISKIEIRAARKLF